MSMQVRTSSMKKKREEEEDGGGAEEIAAEEEVDGHEYDLVMPGFRFHPTEEEIIDFYLRRKVEGKPFNVDLIFFLDLYRFDPWELPGIGTVGDKELFFYVPRDRKYRNGDRPNRVTPSGYWKATGADRVIKSELNPRRSIGLKKTLVFYSGKAPKGVRTTWIMNEYRLPHLLVQKLKKPEISLCRVYNRSELGDRHYHYQYNSRSSSSSSSRTKAKSTAANTTLRSSHDQKITRQLLHIDPRPPLAPSTDQATADHNLHQKERPMNSEILRPTTTCAVDEINMEFMGSDDHHADVKSYLHPQKPSALQMTGHRLALPAASPAPPVQNLSQKCISDWIPITDRNVAAEYYYND